MKMKLLLTLCLVSLGIIPMGEAWARPEILADWQDRYPGSLTEDTVQCQLCHQNATGGDPWNDYGWAIRLLITDGDNPRTPDQAFEEVEMLDSDADPFSSTNVAEIVANTQPGWSPGTSNTIHFKSGNFTTDQVPPIELAAIVQDPNTDPYLNVAPEPVDFSQVKKGRSSTLDVIIANIGQADLSISSINFCAGTSAEFSMSTLNQSSFISSESEVLAVSFNPTNLGLEEGCIQIISNDPGQTMKIVNISGEGVNKISGGDGSKISGGDTSDLTMIKALTAESGSLNGIAEYNENLTYTITLSNSSRNEVTVDVTETVPLGTVHTGSDDFTCTATTEGSSCEAVSVVVPGKSKNNNGTVSVIFSVMVNTQFTDIESTASVNGIDCAVVENNCIVSTPADTGDSVNPELDVLSPGNGNIVSNTGFTVNGTASDTGGIANVMVNDGFINHSTTYSSVDDTWTVDLPGSYDPATDVTLTVTATDMSGNQMIAQGVTVTINDPDNVSPALTVSSPANDDNVLAIGFRVNGTAADAGGIASIIVFDGTTGHPASYNPGDTSWAVDLPSYSDGADVILTVTATDNSGNQTINPAIVVHAQLTSGAINHVRHLLNRVSYGITPKQLAALNGADGGFDLTAYLTDQLTSIDCLNPADVQAAGGIFDGIANPSANLLTLPIVNRNDLQNYAILMAAHNNCQLREVLTQFWDNHFNTDWDAVNSKSGGITEQSTAWELAENDFFRANALGNFRDLVEGSGQSRAMIYYLDGIANVNIAPNENYGRELMELHTLSVDGGYTDQDVVNAAIAFTGWTVIDPDLDPLTDNSFFSCDPALHDYSDIVLNLGDGVDAHPISTALPHDVSTCEFAGQAVFDLLIAHASTGEFICEKLTELLVSDNITPVVVSACETAFAGSLTDNDQIAQLVETILTTAEFTNADNYLDKVKTPLELTAGYLRNFNVGNLGVIPSAPQTILNVVLSGDLDDLRGELDQMSMSLFRFNTPDGFSEQSVDWINSGFLQRRFAFVSDMTFNTSTSSDIYLDPSTFFTAHATSFTAVDIVNYVMELAMQNQHTAVESATALAVLNNTSGLVDGSAESFDDEVDANIKQNRLRAMLAIVLNYPGYQYQ